MAQSDWGQLVSSLTENDVLRGPTAGVEQPPGGGSHVFGMRSVGSVAGALAMYALQNNFSPVAGGRGGRITGVLRRSGLGASVGFAPFLFFCAQGNTIGAAAYILGLSDENNSKIQLRKGSVLSGLEPVPLVSPAIAPNVLMRSTNAFPAETWQHLRLDVIIQGTGDVILQVFRNDLNLHPANSPVWAQIPGMEGPYTGFAGFVDDALGINTGSPPLSGGYAGFAGRFDSSNRAAYFDHITVDRQL